MELEEELKVVGNSLKSLEVSEEKVCMEDFKACDLPTNRAYHLLEKLRLVISVPLKQVLVTILSRVWGYT